MLLEDQYPKLIFDLEDQYLFFWRISIPNQFQKGLGKNSVSRMGLHKGGAQGVHSTKGHAGRAQGVQRERTVHVFPNFFAFQAREMKFGEQISASVLFIGSNFSQTLVAHGHLKFSVAHSHFKKKISLSSSFEYSCTRLWIFEKNDV